MAKRVQWCGKKLIAGEGGIGWERQEDGKYQAELFGVTYELEKRRRSQAERGDSGWYLYSTGAPDGNFFGDQLGRVIGSFVAALQKQSS
ncbi:hypothetical protein OIU91_04175 [Streptomyces sp. NBC_01456]|uniref:hypothetical protein n=1 Tax=unclassified Streptomyces TaxID=2593676 RepID=UPI002E35666F|nr:MULTISPECIES: hypothetical protein [unclassified Streptomyces]